MKKNTGHRSNTVTLRDLAQAKLRAQKPNILGNLDAERLLQELQVHQIELELQNEELIKTRTDLETALASYRELYAFAPVGYCTLGRDGAILKANINAARLFGVARSSLLRLQIVAFVAVADRPDFNRFLEATFAGPGKQTGEFALLAADGQKLSVQIVGALSSDGKECLATIHDITAANLARKALLQSSRQLAEATARAESASRAKSEFLAMMSHEIRTPMSGIIGITNVLLDTPLSSQQKEFVNIVRRSGEDLLEIVNDILDFSKIEAGQLRLEPTNFELENLLGGVVELLEARAVYQGLSLTVEIDPDVPRWIHTDDGRLRQVLFNLVGNALKFTEQGGIVVRVARLAQKASKPESSPVPAGGVARLHSPCRTRVHLRFEVRDSGIGITPKDQEQIFEPFTQVNMADTRKRGGTGLGLAISRRIVERLEGMIGVESIPGKGSVFWFEVEFDTGVADTLTERLSVTGLESGDCDETAARRSPLRILVAEDHPVSRRLVLLKLEKLGYSADVAMNGREAVDLWEQRNHDVIIMDCQMPEMDGFEATQKIRKIQAARQGDGSPPVKIIALTANALPGERQRCLTAGMDDYITKPLRSQALRRILGISLKCTGIKSSDPDPHATAQIAGLVRRIGPKAAAGLMELFLEDTAQRLVDLRRIALLQTGLGSLPKGCDSRGAGIAMEDSSTAPLDPAPVDHIKALAVGAHALAGGCGLFGLERMRELGLGLEAVAAQPGDIPGMVAKLEEEFSCIRSNLLQEITRLQGAADSQPTHKGE